MKDEVFIMLAKIKAFLKTVLAIIGVFLIPLFATAYLNVIPTFWLKTVMDAPTVLSITVRHIITYLGCLCISIPCYRVIKKNIKTIWLAALLPGLVLGFSLLLGLEGAPSLADKYPTYGILLVWTSALWIDSIVLEFIHKTFSWADVFEDFLFSLALSVIFYGTVTLLGQKPLGFNAIAMSPALALLQLTLAKKFHTPRAPKPKQ